MLKRGLLITMVLVLVMAGIAACAPQDTAGPDDTGEDDISTGPQVGGEIVYGFASEPPTLNSILSTDTTSGFIIGRVGNGLVRINQDLETEGDLAKDWSVSEDGLTITFNLRQGVKWHDGEPFTAEDVKFTYDAIMHPDYTGIRASDFKYVEEVEVVDDHTVALHLSQIDSSLLFKLGIVILPEHVFKGCEIANLKEHDASWDPVGTGPYKFVEYVSGEYVVLERNPDYFGEGPYIERVRIRIYQDEQVILSALENGDIDYLGSVPIEDIDRIKESYSDQFEFVATPVNGYDYIGLKQTHPILGNKLVRQALVYGLDRDTLIDTIYKGYGTVMDSHYPPISWAYNPDVKKYGYDVGQAVDLLEEAGWTTIGDDGIRLNANGDRLSFVLVAPSGDTQTENLLSMVEQYWKEIGVEAKVEYYEWSVLLNQYLDVAQFEAYQCGWSLGLDPDCFNFFHSEASVDEDGNLQGFNDTEFRNDRIDELIELGRGTYDQEERKQYYFEIQDILAEEIPYVWLYTQNVIRAMSKDIKGVVWSPLGPVYPERWYIEEGGE